MISKLHELWQLAYMEEEQAKQEKETYGKPQSRQNQQLEEVTVTDSLGSGGGFGGDFGGGSSAVDNKKSQKQREKQREQQKKQ